MNKLLTLSRTDVRNIFRDQILYFMFVGAPIIQFALARFAVPALGDYFPNVIPYYPLIMTAIILQISSGIGFVIASILLDERDEDVLTAIRVLPVSANLFLAYRLLFATSVAFVFGFCMASFSGLIQLSTLQAIGFSLLFALVAPLMMLALTIFSSNKVEGLAIFKGLNFVLFLPLVALFVPTMKWLFVMIPTHWTFQYLQVIDAGNSGELLFLIALAVHLIVLLILIQLFKRSVL